MDCKFCGAQLPEEETLCPECGKDNAVGEVAEETALQDVVQEEVIEDSVVSVEPLEKEISAEEASVDEAAEVEEAPKRKVNIWMILTAVFGCLLLLVVMAVVVLSGTGKEEEGKRNNTFFDNISWLRENDIHCKGDFTVAEDVAVKKADTVVATIGEHQLTNAGLQAHYWMQIYEFLENYGTSYFDYQQPLSTQYYSEEDNLSWEQYFIDVAIESWRRYTLLNIMAKEANFTMDESRQEYIDSLPAEMEKIAQQNGYDNAEAMIQDDLGPACSLEDYVSYMELRNVGLLYFDKKYEEFAPTMEEIEAYYDKNKDLFENAGLKKEDKTVVDVRHILIQLEDGKADSYGAVQYDDKQWEQCKQQAQAVLDEWSKDPTQVNFGELAKKYSKDGSASTGGLYEAVEQGTMVEEFDAWIFDEARKKGDTGLVKTVYGYHVMYFVDREVTDGDWVAAAETQLVSEEANKLIEKAGETWKLDVNYKKIALAEKSIGE